MTAKNIQRPSHALPGRNLVIREVPNVGGPRG